MVGLEPVVSKSPPGALASEKVKAEAAGIMSRESRDVMCFICFLRCY